MLFYRFRGRLGNAVRRLILQISCPQPVCNRDRNTVRPPHLCGDELCCSTAFAGDWATLFVVSSFKFPVLSRYAIVTGTLYGLLIYAVMNYAVLPLSREI